MHLKLNAQILTLLIFGSGFLHAQEMNQAYPETVKDDTADTYFGTEVKDPYRWLEDDRSKETEDWVRRQNEVTENYLAQIPYREQIKERLTELWNYEKFSSPRKYGDYEYYRKNDLKESFHNLLQGFLHKV